MEDVLDLFCSNMRRFDESILESLEYLQEIECNEERAMVDQVAQESVTMVTSQYWNISRNFLHTISDIVCTHIQNEICPLADLRPYNKQFVECFEHGTVGLWDMFPATSFDRRWICESVYRLRNCTEVHALAAVCTGTHDAGVSMSNHVVVDMNDQAARIMDTADCDYLRLH